LKSLRIALPFILKQKTLLFTTDSFVVEPIFFPGGDIGKLSICGPSTTLRQLDVPLSF